MRHSDLSNAAHTPILANDQPVTSQFVASTRPSALYRADLWRLGLFAANHLPPGLAAKLARLLATSYAALYWKRRAVILQNLLPAVGGNRHRAAKLSCDLFAQFGQKMADLLRYESGLPIEHLIREATGWEQFEAAQARRRGILLLTPHLGNGDFGAPLLARRGIPLLVITLVEPQNALTELRQASRARWGIETLVIGEDPFAFVEIIRRLERGAVVA